MNLGTFLKHLETSKPSSFTRALAVLWYCMSADGVAEIPISKIAQVIESENYGKQNLSRLKSAFQADRRVVNGAAGKFKISTKAVAELDQHFGKFIKINRVKESDSILEFHLFNKARGYSQKIVAQLNSSYDYGLFDCCLVMCRRLLETLIIESFEANKAEKEILDKDGNFLMFSGLLEKLTAQQQFRIGRNTLKYLKEFKTLGDLSAHNRRFNARASDIEKVKMGLRVVTEEFLHLANQSPT